MRLAFLSDIHGNARALEAVLEDIEKRNVDQLFVLGDIAYRGLEPERSVELVRGLDSQVIKGNADEWIVRGVQDGEVPDKVIEGMNQERAWAHANMTSESVNYLNELPREITEEYKGINIHGFHATPADLFEVVLPDATEDEMKDRLMVNQLADVYIYGHIHKPYIRYINGKMVVNTGSVGLPFDGLAQPSYVLIDIGENGVQSSIVRTNYELAGLVEDIEVSDYPQKNVLTNLLINASV
ncbi:serine/threonine protein phosphatase [Thalassobacillus devorans]|uniref:Phosphoesterase n=1 Tax=Thalassobacillus devorans TaxID=279813 RepID=A0ABQ1NV54_9BACI|nr:YfcE family phosphodiesterase [Thalassobacillus devorans]NIK28631.1 putative phosphoesterase [Thalassobacillus devorans]GGC84710.1 serine/threonine protein phosphatase [Thalassobacillus devorans]